MRKRHVVVDLDGTLANVDHRRRFLTAPRRDWKAFHEACIHDPPNPWCVRLIQALRRDGLLIELVSGRSPAVEGLTRRWLGRVFKGDLSAMTLTLLRPRGRAVKDVELKREWLRAFGPERVLFAVDDRKRVVDMWREEGIVCLQCDDWEEREAAEEVALRVRAREDRGRSGRDVVDEPRAAQVRRRQKPPAAGARRRR